MRNLAKAVCDSDVAAVCEVVWVLCSLPSWRFDRVTKPRLDFKALPLLRETYLWICHADRAVRTSPSPSSETEMKNLCFRGEQRAQYKRIHTIYSHTNIHLGWQCLVSYCKTDTVSSMVSFGHDF